MTLENHTVVVIGLGLIGGSIARDVAALDVRGVRVVGCDTNAATLDAAEAEGVVHMRVGADLVGIDERDPTIVVVATPITVLVQVIESVSRRLPYAALVMDVASTKRGALAAATSAGIAEHFVGAHPMAGDHLSGWTASRRGLFSGSTVYLCPTPRARADSVELARAFWTALGGRTQIIEANVHDERVAFTSHVPHLAAAAMAVAMAKAGIGHDQLGPGGRDALRLAGSSAELWTAIALDNSDALLKALAAMEVEIATLQHAVERRDERAVHALFSAAQAWTR